MIQQQHSNNAAPKTRRCIDCRKRKPAAAFDSTSHTCRVCRAFAQSANDLDDQLDDTETRICESCHERKDIALFRDDAKVCRGCGVIARTDAATKAHTAKVRSKSYGPSMPAPEMKLYKDLTAFTTGTWLVNAFVPQRSLVTLVGGSSSAKSLLALDWTLQAVQRVPVLFCTAGGEGQLEARISAWLSAHPGSVRGNLLVLPTPANFADQNVIEELCAKLSTLHFMPRLIVIDTVESYLPALIVRATRSLFIQALDYLRWRFGCSVLTTMRHANSAQGVFKSAFDVVHTVSKSENVVTVTTTKNRDGAAGDQHTFTLETVGNSVTVVKVVQS